ncbi:MAG: ABC transporter permease [Hungatella hathewayi]|nr:ABC transporter permease [Hungatella hathewayi]
MKKNKKKSQLADIWVQLKRNKLAVAGLIFIVFLVVVALFADKIAPYSYEAQDLANTFAPPSREHILGTDRLGRDLLSRLIYGSRESLRLGVSATVLAAALGCTMGTLAGYFGGIVDDITMRFIDIYQSIPALLLALSISAALGVGTNSAILAIGLVSAGSFARLLRASIMTVRDQEYVEAGRAIGAGGLRVILKYILPNAVAPVIVQFSVKLGVCIQFGSTMSFLGMGTQAPLSEWGAMLADGRAFMRDNPMLVIYPGICIMLAVLSFNLLGDGLRDAMDPRLRG